jgi:hypothetical protein
VLTNPGQGDCTETTPAFDNCFFISNVDNGWYASGLIVVRQAMPELRQLVDGLIAPMNFGLFYDNRAETHCNVNPAITGNQPTGQMYGGYYAGLPPDQGDNWTHYYHDGALYSDPRISASTTAPAAPAAAQQGGYRCCRVPGASPGPVIPRPRPGPAPGYDMDAAFMSSQQHEGGIHA